MKETGLVVKKSGLPGAGKGLFTRQAIARGEIIVEYTGRITNWKEIQAGKVFNGYVFFINRNHVVDAMKDTKSLGRYANDARGLVKIHGITNNAAYLIKQRKVYIQAIRNIPAGAEIMVAYGKEYWDVIRYNKKLETAATSKKASKRI